MKGRLVTRTVRRLLKTSRQLDADEALRSLLVVSDNQVYDRSSSQWRSVEDAEALHAQRNMSDRIRTLNSGCWYRPPLEGDTRESLSKYVLTTFREAGATMNGGDAAAATHGLGEAFSAIKFLEGVVDVAKDVPREAPYTAVDWGLTPLKELPQNVSSSGATLLVSHPVMPGFFKRAIIILAQKDVQKEVQGGDSDEGGVPPSSPMADGGYMGVMINRPLVNDEQVVIPVWGVVPEDFHPLFTQHLKNNPVMIGGPVGAASGKSHSLLLIHRIPGIPQSHHVCPGVWMSGDVNQLFTKFEQGEAKPEDVLVVMGYSGWGAGQLEGELRQGSWYCCGKSTNDGSAEQGRSIADLVIQGNVFGPTDDVGKQPAKLWCEVLGGMGGPYAAIARLAEKSGLWQPLAGPE